MLLIPRENVSSYPIFLISETQQIWDRDTTFMQVFILFDAEL